MTYDPSEDPTLTEIANDTEVQKVLILEQIHDAIVALNLKMERIAQVVERLAPAAPGMTMSQPQAVQPAPVQAYGAQPVGGQAIPWQTPRDQATLPGWVCPIHGEVKVVPAGVSQRTGKAYNAFLACPIQGCDQKPPRG